MNESFDVAAVAPTGRVDPPDPEAGGAITPADGRRVTRAARDAAAGDLAPRPPGFAARDRRPTNSRDGDDDDKDEGHAALAHLSGAPLDHPDAGVSNAVGAVAYLAAGVLSTGPDAVDKGHAGGPGSAGR